MEFTGSWDRYIPLMKFAYNNSYQSRISMAPYKALYRRRCRTLVCWTELNEYEMIGPNIVKDTEDKVQVIRQRLKEASDQQNSYADLKRRDIEYDVGDKVFLKVSSWRKILQFGQKGKLSPRFIRTYEILERVGPVAYRLASLRSWPNYTMCFMSRCFRDTALMSYTYYQCKRYKYRRICHMMKRQRLFWLER